MLVGTPLLFAWLLHASWPVITGMFAQAHWHLLLAAIALLAAANIESGVMFSSLVQRLAGGDPSRSQVLSVFLVSQGAKYVPGRVWGVALQSALLRAACAPAAVVAANIEMAFLVLFATSGVGLACYVAWEHGLIVGTGVLVMLLVACMAMIRLDSVRRLIRFAARLIPKVAGVAVPGQGPVRLAQASFVAYVLLYVAGWWLMVTSAAGFDGRHALAIVSVMSLAYVVGAVSMLPGGIGAREGTMVLLAPIISATHGDMAAVALLSRAVLLIVDMLLAGIGWIMMRKAYS